MSNPRQIFTEAREKLEAYYTSKCVAATHEAVAIATADLEERLNIKATHHGRALTDLGVANKRIREMKDEVTAQEDRMTLYAQLRNEVRRVANSDASDMVLQAESLGSE